MPGEFQSTPPLSSEQRSWNSIPLDGDFFAKFGEPQTVAANGDELVLKYPQGDKVVSMDKAIELEHWRVSSSQWRQDDYSIEAEFIFDDIPGAKVWKPVAYFNPHPNLEKEFDVLPLAFQEAILKVVREKIQPPEVIATEGIQDFLNYETTKKELMEIHGDIIDLQAPGEIILYSRTGTYTEYYGGSPDERRSAGSYETQGDFYYLTTGVRRGKENDSDWAYWKREPIGIKTFQINKPAAEETAEMVRDGLLAKKRQQLKAEFEEARKITPPTPDPRLYSETPEQWIERYNRVWEQIQAQTEAAWQAEDEQKLAEMRSQYETYKKDLDKISETIARLLSVMGKSSYTEFCRNYCLSEDQATGLRGKLSGASKLLEQRDIPGYGRVLASPEEARVIVNEVERVIEAQKPIVAERRKKEADLRSLLAEVQALAGQKLGDKNRSEYGISYEESQLLAGKLKRAKGIIDNPQLLMDDEFPDISEAENLLAELGQILQAKQLLVKQENRKEGQKTSPKPTFAIPDGNLFATKLKAAIEKKDKK